MKAKNLLEGLERYDGYAVCPGCQGCEGKKVIACRDLIRQAAARIRGQERQIECLMAANEGHRRMLVELHQRLAKAELGWEAQLGLEEMCEDSWRWQKNNPDGYGK